MTLHVTVPDTVYRQIAELAVRIQAPTLNGSITQQGDAVRHSSRNREDVIDAADGKRARELTDRRST